jgi:membrane associated rhomboid family serine protease
MLIPYHADVPMSRRPWMNWVIIGVTYIVSVYLLTRPPEKTRVMVGGEEVVLREPSKAVEPFILGGEHKSGWVLHVFAHADAFHLLGNMLFLWVFGNAVCAKVGNLAYPFVYLGLGLAAAGVHALAHGGRALGASGAINGVIGMYVVWYALNEVSCVYYFFRAGGTINVSGYWLVLLWLAFDIWGAVRGGEPVAYAAHLGGFFAGFGLAWILLGTGLVKLKEGERSLAAVFEIEQSEEGETESESEPG